jgi:hypothetical protein
MRMIRIGKNREVTGWLSPWWDIMDEVGGRNQNIVFVNPWMSELKVSVRSWSMNFTEEEIPGNH